jgi:ribosomal protein L30/L7E
MHFGRVIGHAGVEGVELADRLSKEAAVEDGPVVYDKIPREVIKTRGKKNGLRMWQEQWTNTWTGAVAKAFFPSVRNRLGQKVPVFQEFVTIITEHAKIRSYLHRLGLTDNPICPCEEEEQTTDQLMFQCNKLRNQRNEMLKQKTLVALGLRRMKHQLMIIYNVL